MEKDIHCEHCGAKMVEYPHKINEPMVKSLQAIYKANKQEPTLISDILIHNQICNFYKLKYWGLVTKSSGDGYWQLTDRAVLFLFNQVTLPHRVWTFRDKLIRFDTDKLLGIYDVDEGYQKRDYYVAMANKVRVMKDNRLTFIDKPKDFGLKNWC